MANNFSKNDKGINIEPSTVAGTAAGDLRIDSAASNVPKFHDGSSEDVLVRRTATETLTNKTIVAANNTITTAATGNLAAVELNGALAELQSDIDGREPAITTLSIAKGGTNSGTTLNNNRVMQSSGSAIVEAAAITASRAVVSDANGIPVHATTTAAEIGYVNGVTSAIQTQLDAKAPIASPSFTGDITLDGQASTPSTPSSGYYKAYVKDSTGKLTILNSAGTETAVGGGSGGINLIGDGADAEAGTTGWSTFADAASSRPADGTGGSANVTWTTSSTAPLYGVNSFVFTKDASNRQGEGVSYAFTVSTAHQAKVLQVSFDYIIGSGTFVAGSSGVDSDLIAYIYDVTNSTPIELSSFKLLSNSTTIADRFNATFQTSATGTSYRLILYCATTSASAYTVKFDNISVSPSTYVYGTPITDWTSFTPTGSWSTNTTYTGKWRRVGDSMELDVSLTLAGAPTATGLTVNMPSGYTIDTSKISATTGGSTPILGVGTSWVSGTTIYQGYVTYNSTTSVIVYANGASSTYTNAQQVSSTVPMTWASGDVQSLKFSVPILGWSSSVQTSDQTDTRVVAARAYRSGNQSVSTAAETDIVFNATTFDDVGGMNTSTGVYTVQVPGKYRVKTSLYISSAASEVFTLAIYKTGVQVTQRFFTATNDAMVEVDDVLNCVTGDTIKSTIDSAADTSYTIIGLSVTTFTTIERISGPSAIAASESVSFSANTSTTAATASTPFIYTTKEHDSHGAYSTSTGKFTAPIAGKYTFQLTSYCGATVVSATFNKNGSTVVGRSSPTTASNYVGTGQIILSLVAGDTIEVRPDVNATATTGSTLNTFSGMKIGN